MKEKNDLTQSQSLLADIKPQDERDKCLDESCLDNQSFIGQDVAKGDEAEKNDLFETKTKTGSKCSRVLAIKATGMYIGFLSMGMAQSLIGATLLEVQIQTGATMEQLPLILTWNFLGRLLSSFTAAAIFDRFHPELQMGVSLIFSLMASAVVPLSSMYVVVSIAMAVQGFCSGYLCTASSANCFRLWGAGTGPFLQALHFVFSVGAALTPLIAEPFLTETSGQALINITQGNLMNLTGSNASSSLVTFEFDQSQSLLESDLMAEIGDEGVEEGLVLEHLLHNLHINSTSHDDRTDDDEYSLVFGLFHPGTFYPYMIVVVCQFLASIYFFVQFAMDNCKLRRSSKDTVENRMMKTNKLLMALFMVVLFSCCGVETTIGGLLYTFTVKHLEWDITSSSYLATAYWGVFSGGRLLAIFFATCIRPHITVTCSISLMISGLVVMSFFSHIDILMWLSSAAVGLSLSGQIAGIFTFAGTYIPMSGLNSGLFTAALYAGGMIVPALTGFFCKIFTMSTFPYIQLAFTILLLVVFIISWLFGKTVIGKIEISETISIHSNNESDTTNSTEDELNMKKIDFSV